MRDDQTLVDGSASLCVPLVISTITFSLCMLYGVGIVLVWWREKFAYVRAVAVFGRALVLVCFLVISENLASANSEAGQVCGGRHLKHPGEVTEPGMRPFYAIAAYGTLAYFSIWQIFLYAIAYVVFYYLARHLDKQVDVGDDANIDVETGLADNLVQKAVIDDEEEEQNLD